MPNVNITVGNDSIWNRVRFIGKKNDGEIEMLWY